jgi:hypothetical protein
MKTRGNSIQDCSQKDPSDILREFIDVFAAKGWLNRTLRIRHRDRRYRICCSENEFFAYRINDSPGVSHGFPGWPVCRVTPDRMVEDSAMSGFPSKEPGVHEWLRCVTEGDFELL